MALQKAEKHCINKALQFANLNTLKTTEQVESIFKHTLRQTISPAKVPFKELAGRKYKSHDEAEQAGLKGFTGDQQELQGKLTYLIENPKRAGKMGLWLDEKLQETVLIHAGFSKGKITHHVSVPGVEAAYAYALALIVDADLAKHLRQCPECDRFFMVYDPKKQRKKYCSDRCEEVAKRLQTAKRARNKRIRDKEKHSND